jgi:hypothetical protein
MLPLSQTLSQKPIYFCYSAAHVELGACLTDYSRLELQWENVLQYIKKHHDRENKLLRCLWVSLGGPSRGLRTWWLENQMMFSTFQGWRVMLCVGNLCDWELQVSVLYSQTSDLACLRNFNLSVRSSLLSFLLTSLSYSCGLAPLAAVACPSTLLPLSYSFLTLPCSIPCQEVTFTSPRVATPRGTAKSPQISWAQNWVPLRKSRENGG